MKRAGGWFRVLAVVVLLWAGVARAQVNVTFPDAGLEAAVRSALSVPSGPLSSDKLATLASLNGDFRSISNLTGLEYATNLQTLSLRFDAISDLTPLSSLSQLTYLSLFYNKVSDLRCLTNLTQLQNLDVSYNKVHDATPLLALTNLVTLNVAYNPLSNCSLIGGMASLNQVTLDNLSVQDCSFVNGLTNLTSLTLRYNQIATLPSLPGLTSLHSLDASSNPLTNAAAVAGLTNLDTLVLNYCPVADLSFLPGLPRLQSLYLAYDNLADLSALAGLTNLNYLGVNGNPLTNAAALGTLTNLQSLEADYCSLTNLSFLGNLPWLQTLTLRNDGVTDLDPILDLSSLRCLYLDRNRISDLTGLDGLPALSSVSLVQNLLDLSTNSPAMTVISNLTARGVWVSYDPQNQPPTIQVPDNWTVAMNRSGSFNFDVSDDVTYGSNIVVTVASANTNLIPPTGLALQFNYYTTWNLSLTPAADQTGSTTLTITATDDTGLSTTTNVAVTVYISPTVPFADTNLEAAVRNTLQLLSGPLTAYDLQGLSTLNATWGQGWPPTSPPAPITNLSGLEWATNLTALYLSSAAVTDLTPLRALPVLQTLDLSYNNLPSLALLASLTNLTTLTLDGNPVSSLTTLPNLPNLTSLSAASCSLSNLAGIGALPRLWWLNLAYDNLHDPSPVAALTNLVYLNLQGNPLGGTAGLAGLSSLLQLNLSACSLTTLNGLAGLTNLVGIELDSNPLSSLAPLASLPKLTSLGALGCSLSNLASVSGLTALQTLYIPNNGIRDLAPLAGLTNLNTLYLGGNSPADLAPLDGLSALSVLDLSYCSLSNAGPLAPLTQLRALWLPYNRIADLTPVLALTNLYSLSLTADRVTNITGLQGLTALRWLDVTLNLLDLSDGSPALTTVTNLQNQGANVSYSPQNQPPRILSLRTNWVVLPNAAADLQFAVEDDVTLADKVTLSVACSSDGPLSNSVVTLVRTSFALPVGGPGWPMPLPPIVVLPPPPGRFPPVLPVSPVPLPPLPPPVIVRPAQPVSLANNAIVPILPSGGGVSYWDLNLTPTPNQTGTLTLTLTVTDDTGFSTTQTVLVAVAAPQALDSSFLGTTNLVWQTGGNAPWFGQTNVSHRGSSAAQSGSVGPNEESWLQTTVTGPGILTFWWGRAATGYGGQCTFTTSQGGSLSLLGATEWRMERVSIPAGECVLSWSYIGSMFETSSDQCWLDQVSFVPTSQDFWLEMVPNPTPTLPTVTLHGEPSGFYEIQVSTNLVRWTVLNQVALNTAHGDFTAPVAYASAETGPRFYRARQLPDGTMWFGPLAFDAAGAPLLQLFSKPGTACELLTSTDLHNWSTLATLTNTTGTLTFTDTQPGPARRFYKARQLR
jgi:Leucine-rich repeat (LRR) protein